MKVIINSILPFKGYIAINLFGIYFVRKEHAHRITAVDYNHEAIHTAQYKETLYIGFLLWYITEWLIRVLFSKDRFSHKAYRNISLEREAYENENNKEYINTRKHYSFLKYI